MERNEKIVIIATTVIAVGSAALFTARKLRKNKQDQQDETEMTEMAETVATKTPAND